jgi:hypothetical protein
LARLALFVSASTTPFAVARATRWGNGETSILMLERFGVEPPSHPETVPHSKAIQATAKLSGRRFQ